MRDDRWSLSDLRAQPIRRGNGLQNVEGVYLPDTSPDAKTNFFARGVLSTVNALPEAQRASVLLVYVKRSKYTEAAKILDVPVGTTMSRPSAARKSLNARIGAGSSGKKLLCNSALAKKS